MKQKLLLISFLIGLLLIISPSPAQAACNFYAQMTPLNKDISNWTTTCTIAGGAVEGIDKTTLETGLTNTASLTLGSGGSITINAGGELRTGSLTVSGGTIAIQDTGTIKLGAPLWVADADGDGWPSSFTLLNATASGRRRLALMRNFSTVDCGDTTNSATNTCIGGSGADGAVIFAANTNLNTTNRISGRSCADGGDAVNYSATAISGSTITLSTTPSAGCLAVGDEVLVINLQGISTNSTNTGNYEFATISSIANNTLTLSSLNKYYGNGASDQTNIGTATTNQRVMVQRVPNYTNVTVNAGVSVYPNAWNGVRGGVLAIKASGTLTINGTIHANGLGYRGGGNRTQGESKLRLGLVLLSANNGGGGGATTARNKPQMAGMGGGGGGYGTTGSNGGYVEIARMAYGGTSYGTAILDTLVLGAGGGGGSTSSCMSPPVGIGGKGGGIIYIETQTITNNGTISANGLSGGNGGNYNDDPDCANRASGGGGGGAGGTIYLSSTDASLNIVNALGGVGGSAYRGGGNGGYGRIAIQATSIAGTTNPTYTSL